MAFVTAQEKETITKTRTTEEDVIPAEEAGFPPPEPGEGIMSLRWESNRFLSQLWRNLAYRTYKEVNGKAVLVRYSHISKPPLSDYGALDIINIINSIVNPIFSLSNISTDDANTIYSETRRSMGSSPLIGVF